MRTLFVLALIAAACGDTADCNTADALGLHSGQYKLGFAESCISDGENPGIPNLAGSLPTTVIVD